MTRKFYAHSDTHRRYYDDSDHAVYVLDEYDNFLGDHRITVMVIQLSTSEVVHNGHKNFEYPCDAFEWAIKKYKLSGKYTSSPRYYA